MGNTYQKEKPREKSYLLTENPSHNKYLTLPEVVQRLHFIELLYLFKIIIYQGYIISVICNFLLNC